jgi:hypothetical protein
MSAEQPRATAATDAASAFDALLAGAQAAAAKAASAPVEAPKTESANAAPPEKNAATEPAGRAQLTIFDQSVAAASEKQRVGAFRHLPLAASIVLAAAFGGLAGATTVHLARDTARPATEARMAEATRRCRTNWQTWAPT